MGISDRIRDSDEELAIQNAVIRSMEEDRVQKSDAEKDLRRKYVASCLISKVRLIAP